MNEDEKRKDDEKDEQEDLELEDKEAEKVDGGSAPPEPDRWK